jgi:hypothetical protein
MLYRYTQCRPQTNFTNYSQVGPMLELSTLGCSSTHNNTLHVLKGTAFGP